MNKMHGILVALTMFFFMLLLIGCNNKPVIGFLMDNVSSERWKKDQQLFVKKADELGASVIVKISESDPEKQLRQAEELFSTNIDVLVVIPSDLNAAAEIVKLSHKNNIPVISYDRLIRNCNVDFYISTDNINVGELQADYITRVCPQGKYILIGGATSDYNAFLLHLGWMNILQPLIDKGDISVVCDQFTTEWEKDQAYTIVTNTLKKEADIQAIIAGNDVLASGAIQALKEFDLDGQVFVAGQDADLDAIKNIIAGTQTITIYKPIESMAQNAAIAAVNIANGINPTHNMSITVNNGQRLVPSLLLQGQIVNKQNIKMTVVSEGFVAEQEIFE